MAETIHHAGTKETENTSGRLATINTPQEEGKEDWTVAKGDRRELEVGRGEDLGSAEEGELGTWVQEERTTS